MTAEKERADWLSVIVRGGDGDGGGDGCCGSYIGDVIVWVSNSWW